MTRSTRLTLLVLAILAVAALPAMASPGRGTQVLCYLWANNGSPAINAPYTPTSTYAFNASGQPPSITVTKTGTGTYTVTCQGVGGGQTFARQGESMDEERSVSTEQAGAEASADEAASEASGTWGAGGHVQVTAYGSEDADQCKVSSWSTGGRDFTAFVRCYNHAGGLSDNRFDLLFVW